MEFFFSRDPESPPSPADKQPGSDRNPSPSDFSASSVEPPASSDELSAATPGSSPFSTNGLRAAAQNARGAASAEQEDAPRFLHPFTRYYASIIEREGDPVDGVADRKQKALDDAARYGGLLQQPVEKSSLAALLRKNQTLTYWKYASGLTFSRALPASFLNRLQDSTGSTAS